MRSSPWVCFGCRKSWRKPRGYGLERQDFKCPDCSEWMIPHSGATPSKNKIQAWKKLEKKLKYWIDFYKETRSES